MVPGLMLLQKTNLIKRILLENVLVGLMVPQDSPKIIPKMIKIKMKIHKKKINLINSMVKEKIMVMEKVIYKGIVLE